LTVLNSVKRANEILPNPTQQFSIVDPRLQKVDDEALASSPFRVRARPWTVVAGDGLVSSLVSDFLLWENGFLFCLVDKDAFQEDMNKASIEDAEYCTPLLVNAICAVKSVSRRENR